MATYRYSAKTAQGEVAVGTIEASSSDEAVALLSSRGLKDIQVLMSPEEARAENAPAEVLSSEEAVELTRHVAQLSSVHVPLAPGLRAAADESSSPRVAAALRWMSDQLERGKSLESVLTDTGTFLPRHVSGLVLAAAQTGTLGEALFELVEHQQITQSVRQKIFEGFAYPLVVVVLAVAVLSFPVCYLSGMFRQMFDEFELSLPAVTQLLFWWRDTGLPWVGGSLAALFVAVVLVRVLVGRVRWWRLISTLPLIGPLWYWSGIAEWTSLMSVLLKHQLRLPDALRLAGHGTRNEYIGQLSLQLADGVSRGRKLADLMRAHCAIPATLVPLVDWGERASAFSESFRVGSDLFQRRVQMRAVMVSALVPPLLFVAIGCVVSTVLFGLFLPLVNLISALS